MLNLVPFDLQTEAFILGRIDVFRLVQQHTELGFQLGQLLFHILGLQNPSAARRPVGP